MRDFAAMSWLPPFKPKLDPMRAIINERIEAKLISACSSGYRQSWLWSRCASATRR